MRLSVGDKLGPYEVLALIGRGGMGDVYRAHDPRTGRDVAIKVSAERFNERFDREVRAVAALNHPNICHLYDVGPNYLVMELVEGAPIAPTDSVHTLIDQAIQIADGMAAAQAAGIVHRDLKPGNIMVTREGRIKILDFGLAILEPSSARPADATLTLGITDPGTTVGTVAYMSPEQARGQTVDARSDLWSLGVILYEMCTRRRPFEGPTAAVVFEALLGNVPASPVRQRNPKIPMELERIVGKLLEKDRETRYQSAADLRADLRRVERDSDSAPTVAGRSPHSVRKYGIASATVLILAAGGAFLWQRLHSPPLTDKDVLVLADFTNTTGDPVFDDTLRQALAIQLEQSPFLQIMDDQQMRQDLPLMGRPVGDRISNQVAHDICVREGYKAMIGGAIASLGKTYAITLTATNCQTGTSLAREQAEAEDKEHVLRAVATAASGLRAKLGESLASFQRVDQSSVRQVTTSSLEAFQAYTLGMERRQLSLELQAIPPLRRAVEIDPEFAAAYLQLAFAYGNLGDATQASEGFKKAFDLRDRVSEQERLRISSTYYGEVSGELNKAIEACQLLAQAYPRNSGNHDRLGNMYARSGDYEKALREVQEAVRLDPRAAVYWGGLLRMYNVLNRFDEAEAAAREGFSHNPEAPGLHRAHLLSAYVHADQATAEKEIQWFGGKPEEYRGLDAQSTQALALGQRRKAEELRQRAAAMAERQGLSGSAKEILAAAPAEDALVEDCPGARKAANTRLVQALCGDDDAAQKLAEERAAPPVSRPVEPQTLYLRALALLRSRKGVEAVAAFQNILDHRGANWGPYYAVSYIGLARAAAVSEDTAKARKAYQDFLALWKDADVDIPILIAARKEYAALKN